MPKADNARKRVSAAAALEPAWRRQVLELRAREADLRLQSAALGAPLSPGGRSPAQHPLRFPTAARP